MSELKDMDHNKLTEVHRILETHARVHDWKGSKAVLARKGLGKAQERKGNQGLTLGEFLL